MSEHSDVDRAVGYGVYLACEKPHTHVDEQGMFVKCYHKSATEMRRVGFWVAMTIGYPLEHVLWEGFLMHYWPFNLLHTLLGH
jgi:hypothetical protein